MRQKKNIYFISDIHMGTDKNTNWYQSKIHEGFLERILDEIASEKESNRELVILGDLIDLWTYSVDEKPPQISDIVAKHPNILGTSGKLAKLAASGVKISYVNGNHDMEVTAADLQNIIPGAEYVDSQIYKQTDGNQIVVIGMHGHRASIYNAQRLPSADDAKNPLPAPLPLGYLMTRLTAMYALKRIEQEKVDNAAELKDSGDPNFHSFTLEDLAYVIEEIMTKALEGEYEKINLSDLSVSLICKTIGIKTSHQLILPDGKTTSIKEVCDCFSKITALWVDKYKKDIAEKALFKTEKGDLSWIVSAPEAAVFWDDLDVSGLGANAAVVMGHTHAPAHKTWDSEFNVPGYWNCGFHCPSQPDMQDNHHKKHVSFVKIDMDDAKITAAAAYKVVHVGDKYKIHKIESL